MNILYIHVYITTYNELYIYYIYVYIHVCCIPISKNDTKAITATNAI